MAKWFRKLSFVLAFVLFTASFGTANVYADETTEKIGQKQKELTSIEITNLDEPVPGKPLDTSATVTSAEGESWDIPVIWIDESGKVATVAEAGKRYVPTFAMYVPSLYKIKGTDAAGKFPVRLPAFVTALYGTDNVLFIVDPASQLIYILGGPEYVPGPATVVPFPGSNNNTENKPDSSSEADDDDDSAHEQSLLEKYCAPSAIEHWKENEGFLEWLIDIVMNEIQPQAVKLLMNGFPAYAKAAEKGELSSGMGLYIYNDVGEIEGQPAPGPGALAFALGGYRDTNEFILIMGINTSSFKLVQDDTGKWVMDEQTRDVFDNTVVHEMMHGFMYDYTRNGICAITYRDNKKGFPFWFLEGTASAVENSYQYRYYDFELMKDDDMNGKYTPEMVKAVYKISDDNGKLLLDLNSGVFQTNDDAFTHSAYTSGYLACVYLGYLDARSRGKKVNLDGGGYDIDAIRDGLDHILSQLHGTGDGSDSKTLSEIIKVISGSEFKDTQDFQDKFIKNNRDSNEFVANYLQMLEDMSTSGDVKHANGSILLGNDGQNTNTPIKRGSDPGKNDVYNFIDKSGSAVSEVNDERANMTGGNTVPGNGTHDYAYDEEELAAAAKTEEMVVADVLPATEDSEVSDTDPAVPAIESEVPADPDPVITDPVVTDPEITESEVTEENSTDPAPAAVPEPVVDPAPADNTEVAADFVPADDSAYANDSESATDETSDDAEESEESEDSEESAESGEQ